MTAGNFFFLMGMEMLRGGQSLSTICLTSENSHPVARPVVCLSERPFGDERPGSCGQPGSCRHDDTCEVFEHGDEKRNESKVEVGKQGRKEMAQPTLW